MARKKEFDREEVLEKAMEVFWSKGYEATSIQDLVESMGINRGSLYDTFTDKHTLFLDAIAHYRHTVVEQAFARLAAPEASKQAIIDHFHAVVDRAIADGRRWGCLMTNTIVELSARDSAISACTQTNLQQIENTFYKALVSAQQQGELKPDQDLRALARYLTASMQGLRVISKATPDPDVLRDIVKVVLSVLE